MPVLNFSPVESPAQILQTAGLAASIWPECYGQILAAGQISYMLEKLQSEGAIKNAIASQGYIYHLAYTPGATAPCGYLGVLPQAGRLLLSKLYILAAARGQGYGLQMLHFTGLLAQGQGCSHVWLTVNRQNHRAIALYQKAGYTLLRQQVADIGGGWVMDDFVYEKAL